MRVISEAELESMEDAYVFRYVRETKQYVVYADSGINKVYLLKSSLPLPYPRAIALDVLIYNEETN